MTFRASRRLVAGLAVAAALLALLATRVPWPGRALFLVAVAGTAVEAVRGLVPSLVADDDGLLVTRGLLRERLRWADVRAIRALDPPSSGGRARRRANALEIDLGDRLVLVAGYRLGVPVDQAVAMLSDRGGVGGC